METFQKNTQLIPNANALPATLFNTKTPLLDYLPKLLTFESHLLWTLAQALLDNSLKQWLARLVEPGLPAALERIERQTKDPWAPVFTYLCFGQLEKAAELANSMNAYQVKMLIDLTAIKSMQKEVRNQIVGLKDIDVWNTMTRYQQKVWHVLAGQLGWVDQDYIVVEDQTWQCTLCMYVFYDGFDSNPLSAYHTLKTGGTGGFGQNFAFERTAPPDQDVVWYQMLDWWYGGEQTIKEWPLDLTWLLSFYRPDRFHDDAYALAWISRLQSLELSEWAIYASLFMKLNRDDTLDQLLQSYEWENEDILLHTFYISKERVLCARAINAHQEWDYDAEYGYYLQASHVNRAKDALFNFLLPKLYDGKKTACKIPNMILIFPIFYSE
jgi:hypothetical protein